MQKALQALLVLGGIDIFSDGYCAKIAHGYHGIIY